MSFTIGLDISGIDPTFKEHAARGIGRYVKELKFYFDSINTSVNTKDNINISYFDYNFFKLPAFGEKIINKLPVGKMTVRQQIVYPFQLRGKKFNNYNLLHFPAHMDAPVRNYKPYILTVLDLIPLIFKDLYEPENPHFRFKIARWLEIQSIKNSNRILAISQNTANDLNKILNIPFEKIDITPLGVNKIFFDIPVEAEIQDFKIKYNFHDQRPILLYFGGIDQRKNWKVFFDIIKELKTVGLKENLPKIIIAGKIEKEKNYPILIDKIKKEGMENDIVPIGYISDKELVTLIHLSKLFLFPSLYEGFGLPPLEAMAGGTPVISSNASCMPEILGKAGMLIEPNDVKSYVENILSIINSPDKYQFYKRLGVEQANKFSWESTGIATYRAYEKALKC